MAHNSARQKDGILNRMDMKAFLAKASFVLAFILALPRPLDSGLTGLDPSWISGLYMAALRHLSFGKDIVFTYGPLGFLAAPSPVDYGLWVLSLLFYLGVNVLFFICVYCLLRRFRARWYHYVALAPVLVLALPAVDYLLPLAISIALYLVVMDEKPGRMAWVWLAGIGLVCAGATLIKFNLAIVFGLLILISFLAFLANKKSLAYAAYLFVSYFIFLALAWVAAGQKPSLLIEYIVHGIDISRGYSAMAISGYWYQPVALALLALAVISLIAILAYSIAGKRRDISIFLLVCLPLLFAAYKYSFVRTDLHVLLFLQVYALVAAFLALALLQGADSSKAGRFRMPLALVALAVVLALVVPNAYLTFKSDGYSFQSPGVYVQAAGGLTDRAAYDSIVASRMNGIRESTPLDGRLLAAIGNCTVDIFPWDIALMWADGLNWSPRPVFQSYSAYTSSLDSMNAVHFMSDSRPERVLYSVKSIDGRYPAFDEPATFRALLDNYSYNDSASQFILLNATGTASYSPAADLGNASASFGQPVAVPEFDGAVFGRIRVSPSLYGQAADLLYKPAPLYVQFKLTNGSYSPKYRFIAPQAVDGVFLSDYIADTGDAASAFRGDMRGDIESIVITTDDPAQYSKDIRVEFFGMGAKAKS